MVDVGKRLDCVRDVRDICIMLQDLESCIYFKEKKIKRLYYNCSLDYPNNIYIYLIHF